MFWMFFRTIILFVLEIPIQGVPKIQVNRPPFDGRGQNNAIRPSFVMPKVNRGRNRRRKVKIGLNFKLNLHENQLTKKNNANWV